MRIDAYLPASAELQMLGSLMFGGDGTSARIADAAEDRLRQALRQRGRQGAGSGRERQDGLGCLTEALAIVSDY